MFKKKPLVLTNSSDNEKKRARKGVGKRRSL
jgi:hypothetical protein